MCDHVFIADLFRNHQVGYVGAVAEGHDAFCDALFSATQSAALVPRREVPSLIWFHKAAQLASWCRGHPSVLDVTVILTLQSLTFAGGATIKGHAMQVGEEWKLSGHSQACRSVGVEFICCCRIAFTISRIGRQLGQRSGSPLTRLLSLKMRRPPH